MPAAYLEVFWSRCVVGHADGHQAGEAQVLALLVHMSAQRQRIAGFDSVLAFLTADLQGKGHGQAERLDCRLAQQAQCHTCMRSPLAQESLRIGRSPGVDLDHDRQCFPLLTLQHGVQLVGQLHGSSTVVTQMTCGLRLRGRASACKARAMQTKA